MRPVRLLARQSPYYSNDSQWWSPDSYFEGGQIASYTTPVSGTDDPELYQTERWGNFSYAIPGCAREILGVVAFCGPPRRRSDPHRWRPAAVRWFGRLQCVLQRPGDYLRTSTCRDESRQTDVVIRKFTGVEPNAQGKTSAELRARGRLCERDGD